MLVSVDGSQGTRSGVFPPEESPQRPSADQAPTSQYRILVVDDDQRTRQLVQDILEKHTDVTIVGHARDGKEAVTKAIEHKPDVILMDIGLPYLDGIEATQCIKKACPQTVVICLTEHFSPPKYSAMRTAGAAAFVCKIRCSRFTRRSCMPWASGPRGNDRLGSFFSPAHPARFPGLPRQALPQ